MRPQFILIVVGLLVSLWNQTLWAQQGSDVFKSCSWTLNQISQLELDEQGRLKLKRDQWESAAKQPSDEDGDEVQQLRFGRNNQNEPIDILFEKLRSEAGSMGGSSSSSMNNRREKSWGGETSTGNLLVDNNQLRISIQERKGQQRRFAISESDQSLQLLYFSTTGDIVQIYQTEKVVRYCNTIGGESQVLTGRSFADIVRQNRDHFESMAGWPEFLAELPIEAALEVKLPEQTTAPEPLSSEFPEAVFLDDKLVPLYSVFVRFRVVDGQLRYNWFLGKKSVLDAETETLNREFGNSLDGALKRLKDLDAPQIQMSQLESQFGKWKNPVERREGKFGPLLTAFFQLQAATGSGRAGSMEGGDSFQYEFSRQSISSTIAKDKLAWSYTIQDDAIDVGLSESETSLTFRIFTDENLLVVRQDEDGSCGLTMLSGDNCDVWNATSWLAMVHEHESEFRERVVPALEKYHVSGLDPFHPKTTEAAMERLKRDLPATLDLDEVTGNTDAYLLPLLCNPEYLQLLSTKLDGGDRDLIKARIKKLAGK